MALVRREVVGKATCGRCKQMLSVQKKKQNQDIKHEELNARSANVAAYFALYAVCKSFIIVEKVQSQTSPSLRDVTIAQFHITVLVA